MVCTRFVKVQLVEVRFVNLQNIIHVVITCDGVSAVDVVKVVNHILVVVSVDSALILVYDAVGVPVRDIVALVLMEVVSTN